MILRQVGGFFSGMVLSVSVIAYMDDIMYVPIRRAFIRPVTSYYASQYKPGSSDDNEKIKSIQDVVDEVKKESIDLYDELRPRNVTSDDIKEFLKDNDFTTREQHYFNYIRNKKVANAEKEGEKEEPKSEFKPLYPEDEYDKLKQMGYADIFHKYAKSRAGHAIEYEEFDAFDDMVKIIKQPKRRLSRESKVLKKELENAMKGEAPQSMEAQLLKQSKQYETPEGREEKMRRMEEIKELENVIKEKPDSLKPENVIRYLEAYKGDLGVRDVKQKDKDNLMRLRTKARESSPESNIRIGKIDNTNEQN